MLGLALGLSAHKEYMGDRWSLRCNPSSGNLHPTEAYVISQQIEGLSNGVYHYLSENHSLQQRMSAMQTEAEETQPLLMLALTTISWREAWKYGERAFRYCQLDIGHALAAINYAAACLGWQVELLPQWSTRNIASLCGVDREQDFAKAEKENADLILSISQQQPPAKIMLENLLGWAETGQWHGRANILDKHPMYHWPVISQVEQASEIKATNNNSLQQQNLPALLLNESQLSAKHIIYGRRSAQHFDKQTVLNRGEFYNLLDKCLYRQQSLPWKALAEVFPMLTAFYIHRIDSLTPGLYVFLNTEHSIDDLKNLFHEDFLWSKPTTCPPIFNV